MQVVCVANKAPSSNGGDGSPSSSSTTEGLTEAGELSVNAGQSHLELYN